MERARGSDGGEGARLDQRVAPLVLSLDDPLCVDSSLAGNKCGTLARLLALDYDVPAGFCITTAGIEAGEEAYRQPVEEALRGLRSPWVARSSSTAEDRQNLAFPGLFCTVLDIADVRSLFEEVLKIVVSAGSDGVREYAQHHGVDPDGVQMAVLVQGLVPATTAGVSFSRDPRTSERVVMINSNFGLGETVVDGSVIPDTYVVDESGQIRERRIGSKERKVVVTTHNARPRRVETSVRERNSYSLNDVQVQAVAELTRRLEGDLGVPVDVEFAFVGDRLWILQARPITTLSGGGTTR